MQPVIEQRPDTPAASEADRREAERDLQRAQRRYQQRFWRLIRSYRITFVMLVLGSAAILAVSLLSGPICAVGGSHAGKCLGAAGYWTLWLLLAALLLMANESPPDLVLLGVTTLLLLTRVISNDEAWRGISSPSLLVIAVLFVVARALEETKAVEMLLRPMLGSPKTSRMGVLRLCVPVALASAFLNNTPIVAMLLSVCEGWAARNGLSVHALLMPLSFASMLGGMCTLIGTSTNLVLNAQIENDPDALLEPFTLFSMTPASVPAALIGTLFMALAAPVLLRERRHDSTPNMSSPMLQAKHVRPKTRADAAAVYGERKPATTANKSGTALEKLPGAIEAAPHGSIALPPNEGFSNGVVLVLPPSSRESTATPFVLRGLACYCIEVLVDRGCSLVGRHPCALDDALAEKGRPPATEIVGLKRGSLEYLPGRDSSSRRDIEVADDLWSKLRTQPGDSLLVSCLGDAVPRLRAMRGLTAVLDADPALLAIPPESARHHRRRNPRSWRLVEAVVSASSPLSGLSLAEALTLPELEQTIFWGMRNTHAYRNDLPTVRDSTSQSAQSAGARYLREETEEELSGADPTSGLVVLHPGCTLLLEAPAMWVEDHRISRSFALLGVVGSSPVPSAGPSFLSARALARIRLGSSMLALVVMLLLSAFGIADLLALALTMAYILVSLGCITLNQAWRSISFRVLLTIACSFGLSSALTNTHVSAVLASGLVAMAPVGPFPFLLLIFIFTSLLSCIISNAACVVLLYSVLRTVQVDGLRPAQIMLVMMLGASSAFATPIGYQTNLMVLARGGYRFGDFALLGGGLTVVTGLSISFVAWMLPESLL